MIQHISRLYYGGVNQNPGQTYFGDLYRELGWAGLVIGMAIFGVVLRFFYVWLIDQPSISPLHAGIYFLFLNVVNIEGQYSAFFPLLQRLAIFLIGLVVILMVFRRLSDRFSLR